MTLITPLDAKQHPFLTGKPKTARPSSNSPTSSSKTSTNSPLSIRWT